MCNISFPSFQTLADTVSDGIQATTTSQSVLNAPSYSTTETNGSGRKGNIGLNVNGMGEYRNETLISNSEDGLFLSNLVHTIFYLRGIEIVPAQYADALVFLNVDVFGTIRSRTEAHVYNAETLIAQTKLEYFAVDKNNKSLLIKPQQSSYEAKYQEKYALWMGPYKTQKTLESADKLMVDFSDVEPYE